MDIQKNYFNFKPLIISVKNPEYQAKITCTAYSVA